MTLLSSLLLEGKVEKEVEFLANRIEEVDISTTPAPNENKILEILKEIIKNENVKVTDNFFERGGHSLKVVSLVSELKEQLGIVLELVDIYRAQTIEAQAKLIEQQSDTGIRIYSPIPLMNIL